MADLTNAAWRKSSRSSNDRQCVEVATNLLDEQGTVFVRDSKNPTGPVLAFTTEEWTAFVGGVADGEFSL